MRNKMNIGFYTAELLTWQWLHLFVRIGQKICLLQWAYITAFAQLNSID
jgi:hypothetical protein